MIVADSSAWVELLRVTNSPVDQRLRRAIEEREDLAVTEIVIAELLAGATSPEQALELRRMLVAFPVLRLRGLAGYERAARLARDCRKQGATLRGILDCLVAVPAIDAGARVLHRDRDFDVLARHTPLEVVDPDA